MYELRSRHSPVYEIPSARTDIPPFQSTKVKMRPERNGVNPNTTNKYGLTPLCIAAQKGREKVVKTLLERGDVNPSTANNSGNTPLCSAARAGHDVVVKCYWSGMM